MAVFFQQTGALLSLWRRSSVMTAAIFSAAALRSSRAWIAFSILLTWRTLPDGARLKTLRWKCTMQRCQRVSGKDPVTLSTRPLKASGTSN